ncbi:MAG: FAD-binding oxidoreductase [Acidimicrobiales bacterium]|nr:FAD-binding oxidoreductase [Acidimicrobiales bacterium]|tara:strand:- start:2148 stop:3524 length:1377 start_codon:yes stop_codon:yes gene_type:complete
MGSIEKRTRYSAPVGSYFASRSDCPWIESAGIENAPLLESLRGDQKADVVIIGGGYTGLSSALHIAERFPERRIVLLEGTRVGYGASGRNCGLALPFTNGAEQAAHDLVEVGQLDEARRVFDVTSGGIAVIEDLVERRGLACEWEPVETLVGALTTRHVAHLERDQQMYRSIGLESTWLTDSELRQRVDVPGYLGALSVPSSAMVNPAKLATGLFDLARRAGVEVHEGSPVTDIDAGPTIRVGTPTGSVTAPLAVLATNAYSGHLDFLRGRVLPITAFSIASAPLTDAQISSLSWSGRQPFLDTRMLFDLFRLTADNRVLLSGGNGFICTDGAAETEEGHPDYQRLEQRFRQLFPALKDVPITHRWAGHTGMTVDTKPIIGAFGPDRNLLFAGGYSGHGVTVGVLAGQLLSDLVAGEPLDPAFDGIIDRKLPRVPTGRLLTPGFALAKRIIGWDDSRG